MIKTYLKKPVEIQAVQWTGDNIEEIKTFQAAGDNHHAMCRVNDEIVINTLEGDMLASVGDFIIRGVKGEYYPCKPDIFEATYEEVKKEAKQMSIATDIEFELEDLQELLIEVAKEYYEWPYGLYGKAEHFMPEFEKLRQRIDNIFQLASLEDE